MRPHRSPTVHTEVLNDEICLYEWTTKTVHRLNATAARVWTMCDGKTTISDMAARLGTELAVTNADDLVSLAIDEFTAKQLLARDPRAGRRDGALSRREVMVRLGASAAVIPVVSSIVAPGALEAASLTTVVYSYTGSVQTFVVPPGVTQITVRAWGASGGTGVGESSGAPGLGGRVEATVPVTPGESLSVYVGGKGGNGSIAFINGTAGILNVGGYNGGGNSPLNAGSGGGASDVRRSSTKLVVAGGGGGQASATGTGPYSSSGGDGGGTTGGTAPGGGGGGTQSAGGTAGPAGPGGTAGSAGSAGLGGDGASAGNAGPGAGSGGGGGGGYYGGGGGGSAGYGATPISEGITSTGGYGGGGGSGYVDGSASLVSSTNGIQTGNGQVNIVY